MLWAQLQTGYLSSFDYRLLKGLTLALPSLLQFFLDQNAPFYGDVPDRSSSAFAVSPVSCAGLSSVSGGVVHVLEARSKVWLARCWS